MKKSPTTDHLRQSNNAGRTARRYVARKSPTFYQKSPEHIIKRALYSHDRPRVSNESDMSLTSWSCLSQIKGKMCELLLEMSVLVRIRHPNIVTFWGTAADFPLVPGLCSTLRHAATYCNTRQRAAMHCNTLEITAILCNTLPCLLP